MASQHQRAAWFRGGDVPCEPMPHDRPHRLVLLGPPGAGKLVPAPASGTPEEILARALAALEGRGAGAVRT